MVCFPLKPVLRFALLLYWGWCFVGFYFIFNINSFFPNFLVDSFWKPQNIVGFLMFSEVIRKNLGRNGLNLSKMRSVIQTNKHVEAFLLWISRSSHQRCSMKKTVLTNFAKFTGKHLRQSLFCNEVARLRPATLLKKRLWHRCFPVNFAKFLSAPFFTEHFRETASKSD